MNVINKDEIMDKCIDKAMLFVSNLTGESVVALEDKFIQDVKFHRSLRHLAGMYFEFETNEIFKHKQLELEREFKRLGLS